MRRFICFFLLVASYGTLAEEEATETALKVVAAELSPCVIAENSDLAGFAVDLWEELAEIIGREYTIESKNIQETLNELKASEADIAIGCISVNQSREADMDFTHPIAGGGLLAVSQVHEGRFPAFSNQSKFMLLLLLGLVILFAHLMWWSEHGKSSIDDRYFPGIIESVWFSIVTMSTVGYGDIAPKKWLGRVAALLIILVGVTAFGIIVGQFAADAVKPSAMNPVEKVQDLYKYRIGTKANTATVDFLAGQGIEHLTFENLEDGIDELKSGAVDLILHDTVAIQYQVHKHSDLIPTGPTFNAHYLGFALQQDSDLTEPINLALLKIQENGQYESIFNRWFDWDSAD